MAFRQSSSCTAKCHYAAPVSKKPVQISRNTAILVDLHGQFIIRFRLVRQRLSTRQSRQYFRRFDSPYLLGF
ncbi:MAG: hypothetical protein CMG97_00005, partial [Marinovum sp.]|nr:hypothetical protein [Marinovum sp.]